MLGKRLACRIGAVDRCNRHAVGWADWSGQAHGHGFAAVRRDGAEVDDGAGERVFCDDVECVGGAGVGDVDAVLDVVADRDR